MTTQPDTFVLPEYRLNRPFNIVDGIRFNSYSTGINKYARISEDGQIKISFSGGTSTYLAEVIGHGFICSSKTGKAKRFRTRDAAAIAAIKIWRELHK
jgi:hypothetical protein